MENPEIFASYDGIFWTVPDGAQNPLAPAPKIAGDHNSDPAVAYPRKLSKADALATAPPR